MMPLKRFQLLDPVLMPISDQEFSEVLPHINRLLSFFRPSYVEDQYLRRTGLLGEVAITKWITGSIEPWIRTALARNTSNVDDPDLHDVPDVEAKTVRWFSRRFPLTPAGRNEIDLTKRFVIARPFNDYLTHFEIVGWIDGVTAKERWINGGGLRMPSGSPAARLSDLRPTWEWDR
jgi:hypothetical protein